MPDITVLKREGTNEKFSIDKVIASIAKAGMPLESAEKIANDIANWAKTKAKEGKIHSGDLKTKIVEEMNKIDPLVASTYNSFVK